MPLLVPISVGELLDKITILEIKAEVIADPAKHANVMRELAALDAVRQSEVAALPELDALQAELQTVNRQLWRIEDDLRAIERTGRFDERFVELARSVYRSNDERAALKRRINQLTGSEIVEEKSYL
jgi:predicted  nucleic acid-binding Zn-ribbon protein